MRTHGADSLAHQLVGAGRDKGQNTNPLRHVQNRFRLPAQEVCVEIAFILVSRNVTKIREMQGLCMQHALKRRIARLHSMLMQCKVCIELTGHALEFAVRGGKRLSELPALLHDGPGIRSGAEPGFFGVM